MAMICGTLVYYHCAFHNSSLVSLISDVFIVILCSLSILGLLFRQLNISVLVDPMEWQISQDTASRLVASLANTVGTAESVLRVAVTGHDKRLFLKVVLSLCVLSVLGRSVSGITVAYAGLCLFCLYILAESSPAISSRLSRGPSGLSRFSSADFNPAHLVSGDSAFIPKHEELAATMDRNWMFVNRLSTEYDNGVNMFIQFPLENARNDEKVPCPCTKCLNDIHKVVSDELGMWIQQEEVEAVHISFYIRFLFDKYKPTLHSFLCPTRLGAVLDKNGRILQSKDDGQDMRVIYMTTLICQGNASHRLWLAPYNSGNVLFNQTLCFVIFIYVR